MSERKIDGRKAEITNAMKEFSTYTSFAIKYGYPDAAVKGDEVDKRKPLKDGDVVTLLVLGKHEWSSYGSIWIVEANNGERHLIGEDGLCIINSGVTVLSDESLGGTEREYHEVKRKANVGDLFMRIEGGFRYVPGVVYKAEYVDDTGAKDARIEHRLYHENYVVLEPTDIVRIDDERLRMLDREAAVGERLIIVNEGRESSGGYYYRIGNVGVMLCEGYTHGNIRVDFSGNDEYRGDGKWAVSAGDYRVLEPVKDEAETEEASATQPLSSRPATEQAAENIAALTAKVQALESRLDALYEWHKRAAVDLRVAREDIVLIEEGVSGDIAELREKVAMLEPGFSRDKADATGRAIIRALESVKTPKIESPKTAQQLRDEIVERAKADVKALSTKIYGDWRGSYVPAHVKCGPLTVDFVVNRDKRKVTSIIRLKYFPDTVEIVGRAKCAPNDVFNAHIGRAISLRRALGLEVPAEYLSVPNPTEVRVGDVVAWKAQGGIVGRVCRVSGEMVTVGVEGDIWCFPQRALDTTDDSREEAEDSASSTKGEAA